jgi:hypothetical protein
MRRSARKYTALDVPDKCVAWLPISDTQRHAQGRRFGVFWRKLFDRRTNMRVIMFQDRFASLVANGTKRQTIRKTARCKVSDTLSLRRWSGKPYRSKQVVLCEAQVVSVRTVRFAGYFFDGGPRDSRGADISLDAFAQADGFGAWRDMCKWFEENHGLPFEGVVIYWSNATGVGRAEDV